VKEGQLLFQLDPKPFEAQLDAAKGEVLAQQARFTTADANLKRIKPLASRTPCRRPISTRRRASSTHPGPRYFPRRQK